MNNNIFKYGPEYKPITFKNSRNVLFSDPIVEDAKVTINDSVENTINNSVTNFVTTNLGDIITNTSFFDVITNTVNSTVNNVVTESIVNNIDNSVTNFIDQSVTNTLLNLENISLISPWSFNNDENIYTFTNVVINSSKEFNEYNLYINGNTYSTKIDAISINLENLILKNGILNTKNDNQLYFNNEKISNIENNNELIMSSWSIDSNENTFTYSNVGIKQIADPSYDLSINDKLLVGDSLYLKDSNNKIHVSNDHLYFNNCRLDKCDSNTIIQFYFCFNFNKLNLESFENNIKNQLKILDSNIDFTYLKFTFNDTVKVTITIRDDICINDNQKITISTSLKKIYNIISNNRLSIIEYGVRKKAILNIYLLNEYYHYENLDTINSFKLVDKNDESNNKALKTGQRVYLKNLSNEYLKTNYTFSKTTNNRLLLEVHGYEQNFLVNNTQCIINRKDGFKLEVLPPTIIDNGIPSIIVGENYMNNINDFSYDTIWENPGINPDLLTDDIYLSNNIESYVTDPENYKKIYLVDQRWLTYDEDSSKKSSYNYTFNDTLDNSQKFFSGILYCEISIADYVFNENYNLESIEKHAKLMFKYKHLPGLCSIQNYENYINIYGNNQRREEMLEELEKAHIYIYNLHNRLIKIEKLYL